MRKKKIDELEELDRILPYLDDDHHHKMDFAKKYLSAFIDGGSDDTKIRMGSIRMKTMLYFIYTAISEYDDLRKRSEILHVNPPWD